MYANIEMYIYSLASVNPQWPLEILNVSSKTAARGQQRSSEKGWWRSCHYSDVVLTAKSFLMSKLQHKHTSH